MIAGCDQVQGFYFSRPVPATEVEKLLAQKKPMGAAPDTAPAA